MGERLIVGQPRRTLRRYGFLVRVAVHEEHLQWGVRFRFGGQLVLGRFVIDRRIPVFQWQCVGVGHARAIPGRRIDAVGFAVDGIVLGQWIPVFQWQCVGVGHARAISGRRNGTVRHPVSFISLGLGLVANLLIWPICWAVQTFFLKAVFGYVPDDWMMTPQKGLLYTFVGFCAFIVMYLTAKYAAVLANGIMVGKLVCYAMMAVIALLILSRLSGMGHTALVPTSYSNIFASFNMAFLPGLVMFVGALLCAAADNAVSSSRKKGIGLYVVATLVLLFASVEIAAMATSLSAALI